MVKEQLLDFLRGLQVQTGCSEEEQEQRLEDWGVDMLLPEVLCSKERRNMVQVKRLLQKHRNRIFAKEIRCLLDAAAGCGIKVVLLKGLPFAETYYYPKSESRSAGDIDVLVQGSEFRKFIGICTEAGYRLTDGTEIPEELIERYASEDAKDQHFEVLCKKSGIMDVHIDVHIRLFWQQWFGCEDTGIVEDLMDRSTRIDEGKYEGSYQLEVHDLLLYQQIHFIQHFLKGMLEGVIDGKPVLQKRLNLLHDIACLLEKERDRIDWEYFLSLVRRYRLDPEAAFALRCVDSIYPGRISHSCLERLEEREIQSFFGDISSFFSKKDFKEILLTKETKLLEGFIAHHIKSKPEYLCKKNAEKMEALEIHYDGEHTEQLTDGSGSVASAMKTETSIWWKEESLCMEMKSDFGHPYLKQIEQEDVIYDKFQDYLMVSVFDYTPEEGHPYVRRFIFRPVLQNGEERLLIQDEYNGNYGYEFCTSVPTEYAITDTGYTIRIRIPWELLGMEGRQGQKMGLMVECNHYDEASGLYATMNSAGAQIWHDIIRSARFVLD